MKREPDVEVHPRFCRELIAEEHVGTGPRRCQRWRAGLTPTTIYQILKKSEKQVSRPPRKSTVQAFGRAIGAQVMFNSKTNMVFLHFASVPESPRDDLAQFTLQIAEAIRQSGRTEIPRDERDKILRVLRVLL